METHSDWFQFRDVVKVIQRHLLNSKSSEVRISNRKMKAPDQNQIYFLSEKAVAIPLPIFHWLQIVSTIEAYIDSLGAG